MRACSQYCVLLTCVLDLTQLALVRRKVIADRSNVSLPWNWFAMMLALKSQMLSAVR